MWLYLLRKAVGGRLICLGRNGSGFHMKHFIVSTALNHSRTDVEGYRALLPVQEDVGREGIVQLKSDIRASMTVSELDQVSHCLCYKSPPQKECGTTTLVFQCICHH